MFMDQAKKKNDTHAYLAYNKAHMAPFAYTKLKVPLAKEELDLVPLEPSKKISTEATSPKESVSQNTTNGKCNEALYFYE